MRKFTCGSPSRSKTKSISAGTPQTFVAQAACTGEYYNRLDAKPSDRPFRPTQNALDLVRHAVSQPLSDPSGQVCPITRFAFPGSLPFLWRPRRNTLLGSCGPLRKGITP